MAPSSVTEPITGAPWPHADTGFAAAATPEGTLGCVVKNPLTQEDACALVSAGVRCCIRTLGGQDGLTAGEACLLRDAGLGIMVIYEAACGAVSADQGRIDGGEAMRWAKAAGLPAGASVFCRLSVTPAPDPSALIDYHNAWAKAVASAVYTPGLCISDEALTNEQLTNDLHARLFFRDSDAVSASPAQGFVIVPRPGGVAIQKDNRRLLPAAWPARSASLAPRISGTELANQLGSSTSVSLPATQQTMLDKALGDNAAPVTWIAVTSSGGGHELTFFVSADALRIGTIDDSLRIDVSAVTAQRIADGIGCVLPTTKLCDLIWASTTVKVAYTSYWPFNYDVAQMVKCNNDVDAKVATAEAAGASGLIENAGKYWLITNKINGKIIASSNQPAAANYGFYYDAAGQGNSGPNYNGPYHLVQSIGTQHDCNYTDYSQVMRLVQRWCIVDGAPRDIVDVMTDATLSALVSDEGPLQIVRQPGVDPPCATAYVPPNLKANIAEAIDGDRDATTSPCPHCHKDSALASSFTEASHYQGSRVEGGQAKQVSLIVLHTAEQNCGSGVAQSVANYFAREDVTESAHYVVDPGIIVQCVCEKYTAWHAKPCNYISIGIEHAARTGQPPTDWSSTCAQQMLDRSARLAADICLRLGLPAERVDKNGLLANKSGITMHSDVSAAYPGQSNGHTDPGANFPIGDYINRVKQYMSSGSPKTDSPEAGDYVQASYYQSGRNDTSVTLVVVHTADKPCQNGVARQVANAYAAAGASASAHYVAGPDEILQCVREADTAWHAKPCNFQSIGVDHAANQAFTAADWASPAAQTMLQKSAKLVADICARHNLPPSYVNAAGLSAPSPKGITTHADVATAFKQSTATDPGTSFPMAAYIQMVNDAMGLSTAAPAPYGLLGVDTASVVSSDRAKELYAAGYRYCARYVELGAPNPNPRNLPPLTQSEASALRAAGLAIVLVQYHGSTMTSAQGTADGQAAANNALALGAPRGMNLFCDIEAVSSSGADAVIAYCNAWYNAVSASGFVPGLYVGADSGLSQSQIDALPFRYYWRSASLVPNVSRGYQLLQLYPGNVLFNGQLRIDIDVTQNGYYESTPSILWWPSG